MEALIVGDASKVYDKLKVLKREDVVKIQDWLACQPHLPQMTEMQIIHFLHSNYFSNERAKKCIDTFFTVRTHCPEFFHNRDPSKVDTEVLMYGPFPKRTAENYRIIYARLINTNPDRFNFPLMVKCFDMTTMLMLNVEGPAEGLIYIHDLKGLSFSHLAKINPLHLKKFFFYLQECMSVRIKQLHFINIGNFMDTLLAMIKPFMQRELIAVLYTHPTMDTVYKFIPKDFFPSDFEGGDPSFSVKSLQDASRDSFLANAAFYAAEERQQVDESKRPGKPMDVVEMFGVEGTFKKLDID